MAWDPRSPYPDPYTTTNWWDDPRFVRTPTTPTPVPVPVPAPPPGPAPTVPLPTVPSPIAPEEFAAILYGQGIPSILASTVEVGGRIIEGPYFGAAGNEIICSFIAAYYHPVNYWDDTRTVTKLRFHGKEAWNSVDGVLLSGLNVGGATTGTEQRVRFQTGTLDQQPDAWSIGIQGVDAAIAYIPLVVGIFENIRILQFNNQVPFTSVVVQDTAFGDPDDLIPWADALPAIMRFAGRPADEFEAIDVSEGEYAYIFNGKLMDTEFLAGMIKLKPNWSILTKDKLYVVEKGETSLDWTIDIDRVIKRGFDPITIHDTDILSNPREKLVNFSDVERDYENSTIRVAEDLEPVVMTVSFDSETLSFPGASTAARMLGMANFAYETEHAAREKSEFTGNRSYLGIDPGDTYLVTMDGVGHTHRVTEVVRKADLSIDTKGEGILTCGIGVGGYTSLYCPNLNIATVPYSSNWDLSLANSDQFTIEYSYWQEDKASDPYEPVNHHGAIAGFGLKIRHHANALVYFWSSDGTAIQSITAAAGVGDAQEWVRYRISKNSAGKIRIFMNGVMVGSGTPADSTINPSTGYLALGSGEAGRDAYMDNVRITKGVCRDDSDANYSLSFGVAPDPHFASVVFLTDFNGTDGGQDPITDQSSYGALISPSGFAVYSTDEGEIGSFPTS